MDSLIGRFGKGIVNTATIQWAINDRDGGEFGRVNGNGPKYWILWYYQKIGDGPRAVNMESVLESMVSREGVADGVDPRPHNLANSSVSRVCPASDIYCMS